MTEIETLQNVSNTLQEMLAWIIQFDGAFRQLQQNRERAALYEPFEEPGTNERNRQLIEQVVKCRQNIMQRQDEATRFLNSVRLPAQWHVSPAPAIGGPVEVYNIFDAFIAITGDIDPRPNLIHMTDLLEKGKMACQRLIKQYQENPPNALAEKVKSAPRHLGPIFSWLFPTEKQRGVLGWVLIAGLVALILRYVFGVHLEELGKLLAKWFTK
jgi:hypothetical protein